MSHARLSSRCQLELYRAVILKVKDMIEIMSGQDLIDAGMPQGKWFGKALS